MSVTALPIAVHIPNWFVLFVRSNQEKKIAQHLTEREIEHFLPCWQTVRQWKNRRVTLQVPLFPGYLFVRLPFLERSKVLTIPNVVSLVGSRNSPSIISEEELKWIKCGIERGGAMPHPYLAAGQSVAITKGAFSGMRGILIRQQRSARVVVCLDSIARSFVVEVDLAAIELNALPVNETRSWSEKHADARHPSNLYRELGPGALCLS